MNSLLLSGWTQPHDALAPLIDGVSFDYSAYPSPEASFEGLKPFADLPYIIAWSMGGQLALRAIAANILKPRHLTLIAAPYQFVGTHGMDEFTFTRFRENYASDPARSKERFHALIAKGDRDGKRVMANLTHHPEVENTARFLPWLDDLGRYCLDESALAHAPPTLIIHGMNDAIVPHTQSEAVVKKLPRAQLNSWAGVGHAPHLHDPARLVAEINAHRALHGVG